MEDSKIKEVLNSLIDVKYNLIPEEKRGEVIDQALDYLIELRSMIYLLNKDEDPEILISILKEKIKKEIK